MAHSAVFAEGRLKVKLFFHQCLFYINYLFAMVSCIIYKKIAKKNLLSGKLQRKGIGNVMETKVFVLGIVHYHPYRHHLVIIRHPHHSCLFIMYSPFYSDVICWS